MWHDGDESKDDGELAERMKLERNEHVRWYERRAGMYVLALL